MDGREAEYGHDGVAHELLDRAAVAFERRAGGVEVLRLDPPPGLGVEPPPRRRRTGEVGEEDGDRLAHVSRALVGRSFTGRRRFGLRRSLSLRSPLREELSVLAEDGLVELPQAGSRLEPELIDEKPARLLVDGKRLRLAARAVEGEHELSAEALPQRLGRHERLQLRHQLAGAPEGEVGLDPLLQADEPEPLEPADRRLREGFVTDVGEGGPAPEREGVAERGGCSRCFASGERQPPFLEEPLEATGIDRFRREIQHVPGRHRADDIGPQRLAQARDGDRERAPWTQARPEVLDQPVARHHLTRPKRKKNKQRTRLPAREGNLAAAVVLDFERAEQTDVNHCQRTENGLKEPPCIVALVTKRRKGRCVMGRKLFGFRSLLAAVAVAAIAAPAGHAASGIGNPASAALRTAGESRPALTPEQCAALPAVLRTRIGRTRIGVCLQGEPGVGASAVETTATQVRPARPLPLESLSLAQRTAPADAASPVGDSFDWLDAGIGGSVGIAALLLVLAGAGLARSRRLAHS